MTDRLSMLWLNLTCLALLALPILSQASSADIALQFGSESVEYFPHFGKRHEQDREFSGYIREVVDAFSKDEKVTIQYHLLPIKRLYFEFLQSKTIDIKYPDNPQWQKAARAHSNIYYSSPVVQTIDGVITHTDNAGITLNQLKRLGIIRGFTPEAYLANINSGSIKISEYSKSSDMLIALLHKRIDGAYINIDVANYQIQRMKNASSKLEFNKNIPHTRVDYRLSSIKHPDIIRAFDKWMMRKSEFLCQLKQRYQLEFNEGSHGCPKDKVNRINTQSIGPANGISP